MNAGDLPNWQGWSRYWEFPGLDHAMADAQGISRMEGVLAQAAAWLEMTLAAAG